jgi:hypothetical protein
MTRFTWLVVLVLAGVVGHPGSLDAQVRGLPVRNAGIGTGVGIAADVGFPNTKAGNGIAYGATGSAGLGPIGFTASLARFDPKGLGNTINSVGATANLKVFGGPLVPFSVTLQAGAGYDSKRTTGLEGAGYSSSSIRTWHLPVGLGLAVTIPNPVFSIKPWIAPRLDVTRVTQPDGGTATTVTDTNAHFGLSAGVDLGFLNGFTIRAAYDRVSKGQGMTPAVVSVGLGFRVGK